MSAASASICSRRRGHLRQPRVTDFDALQAQSRLGQGHTAESAHRVRQRGNPDIDLASGGVISGSEGAQHVSQLAGRQM